MCIDLPLHCRIVNPCSVHDINGSNFKILGCNTPMDSHPSGRKRELIKTSISSVQKTGLSPKVLFNEPQGLS